MARETTKHAYSIQGKKLWQVELTIGQDIELVTLFSKLDGDNMADVPGLLTELTKEGLIEQLFGIILKGPINEIDILEIPNSIFEKIVTDFLALNDGLLQKLRSISPVVNKG